MPKALSIGCSLSADDLPERLRQMTALGRDGLLNARTDTTRAQLRFTAGAAIRERVEAIIAAEAQCCAFLTMRVSDEPDALVLTIDGPAGAEVVLAEMVRAFTADATVAGCRRTRRGAVGDPRCADGACDVAARG